MSLPKYEVCVPLFLTVIAENADAAAQLALSIIEESNIEGYNLVHLGYAPDDVSVVEANNVDSD